MEKSFDDPRKMNFLNFMKSGSIYYATFYGEWWAAMEVIFGWFTLRTNNHSSSHKSQKNECAHARMCPTLPYTIPTGESIGSFRAIHAQYPLNKTQSGLFALPQTVERCDLYRQIWMTFYRCVLSQVTGVTRKHIFCRFFRLKISFGISKFRQNWIYTHRADLKPTFIK